MCTENVKTQIEIHEYHKSDIISKVNCCSPFFSELGREGFKRVKRYY